MGYKCSEGASTESCFSKAKEFLQSISHILKDQVYGENYKFSNDPLFFMQHFGDQDFEFFFSVNPLATFCLYLECLHL